MCFESSRCDLLKLKISVRRWFARVNSGAKWKFSGIFPHFLFQLIKKYFHFCWDCVEASLFTVFIFRLQLNSSLGGGGVKREILLSCIMSSRNADGTIIKRRTMVSTMKINIRYPMVLIESRERWRKKSYKRIKHKRKNQSIKAWFWHHGFGLLMDAFGVLHYGRISGQRVDDDINFYFSHDVSRGKLKSFTHISEKRNFFVSSDSSDLWKSSNFHSN